MKWWNMYTNSQ